MILSEKPKDFDRLAFELGTQVHKHTIQFLAKGGKYGHRPYGTGVLVFANNKCLIITAAHVTADFDNTPLFVTSNKGIIPIVGNLRETDIGKDKTTDLAYIILDDAIASILVQTYDFLPISKILHSHVPINANQYLVVGYPEVNIRAVKEEKTIYAGSSIFLLTMSKEEVYEFYKFDKNKDYILDFAGKGIDLQTDEKSGKIQDPYGMSGCGLWLLTEKPTVDTIQLQYHLIGIMTQFRKGKYHCLIGNRIEIVMSALIDIEKFNIQTLNTPNRGFASMLADE